MFSIRIKNVNYMPQVKAFLYLLFCLASVELCLKGKKNKVVYGLSICIVTGQLVLSIQKTLDWLGFPSLVAIFDPASDQFVFCNIAKIDPNVAKTNFCNIFVAKTIAKNFAFFDMLQSTMLQTFCKKKKSCKSLCSKHFG